MSEHSMAWIRRREDIQGGGTHWYEVACSCGWKRKYPSNYRAHFMFEEHAEEKR
jgi:hypothetical protein